MKHATTLLIEALSEAGFETTHTPNIAACPS